MLAMCRLGVSCGRMETGNPQNTGQRDSKEVTVSTRKLGCRSYRRRAHPGGARRGDRAVASVVTGGYTRRAMIASVRTAKARLSQLLERRSEEHTSELQSLTN